MTTPQPCRTDPAMKIIGTVADTLGRYFDPAATCKAKVGTTTDIRFFAGDGAPLEAWNSHASSRQGCSTPFVWVRSMRRYRSQQFPTETISTNPCGLLRVMPVEIGVAWCAAIGEAGLGQHVMPTWAQLATEAEVSMDTAWRIEEALCAIARALQHDDSERLVGTGALVPYGPDAGVIAWTGVLYASY